MRRMARALLVFATLAATLVPVDARCDEALDRAIALTTEKRYSEARAVLDSILERTPDSSHARLLHGILRARAGRLNEAIEIFELLRDDAPDMPEPYNNLAVLYAVQGRLDDAREILLATLERQPSAVAYANLGDLYASLARRAYDRANELDPDVRVRSSPGTGLTDGIGAASPGSSITAAMRSGPPADEPESQDDATIRQEAAAKPDNGVPKMSEAAEETRDSGPRTPGLATEPVLPPVVPAGAVTVAGGVPSPDASASAATVAGAMPSPSASAPSALCARVGGFMDPQAAADAVKWLKSQGAEVMDVHRRGHEVTTRHRVFLPPFATRAQASKVVREIRSRGVGDIAVIGSGTLENGISFGVYASEKNMRRRVSALRELGYDVQSGTAAVEVVDGYVIEARVKDTMQDLKAAWTPRLDGHPIQPVDCG